MSRDWWSAGGVLFIINSIFLFIFGGVVLIIGIIFLIWEKAIGVSPDISLIFLFFGLLLIIGGFIRNLFGKRLLR